MSGFVHAMGFCIGCHQPFAFNPLRVPSVTVNGTREPICAGCVERFNLIRKEKGLPLIVPLPDAYEAIPEEELP